MTNEPTPPNGPQEGLVPGTAPERVSDALSEPVVEGAAHADVPDRVPSGCCVACGYNLQGMAWEADCPECGMSIKQSLRSPLICLDDVNTLYAIELGASQLGAWAIMVMLMPLCVCCVAISLGWGALVIGPVYGLIWTLACKGLTTVSQEQAGPWPHKLRQWTRMLLKVQWGCGLGMVGLFLLVSELQEEALAWLGGLLFWLFLIGFAMGMWCLGGWLVVVQKLVVDPLNPLRSKRTGFALRRVFRVGAVCVGLWVVCQLLMAGLVLLEFVFQTRLDAWAWGALSSVLVVLLVVMWVTALVGCINTFSLSTQLKQHRLSRAVSAMAFGH